MKYYERRKLEQALKERLSAVELYKAMVDHVTEVDACIYWSNKVAENAKIAENIENQLKADADETH